MPASSFCRRFARVSTIQAAIPKAKIAAGGLSLAANGVLYIKRLERSHQVDGAPLAIPVNPDLL